MVFSLSKYEKDVCDSHFFVTPFSQPTPLYEHDNIYGQPSFKVQNIPIIGFGVDRGKRQKNAEDTKPWSLTNSTTVEPR